MAGALVLNAGYEPIKIVDWQKAILLWFQNRVDVLEFHNESVRSPTQSFRLPSVLRLKQYIHPYFAKKVRLSRQNVFSRDRYICQYCYEKFPIKKLTIDHIQPISRGGRNEWENLVTACSQCNNRKGSRTPEEAHFKLLKKPVEPDWLPNPNLDYRSDKTPVSWQPYIKHTCK